MQKLATIIAVATLTATSAWAGVLAVDSNGMAGWQGTVNYSGMSVLAKVDYCVYAPGQFALSFSGLLPEVSASDYVYAYQVYDLANGIYGAAQSYVLQFSVGLDGDEQVDVIGAKSDGGASTVTPASSYFAGDSLTSVWNFNPTIQVGQQSAILYFSSPFAPEWDQATVSGWFPAGTQQVPSPTPEPATLSLLGLGALALCRRK